MEPISTGSFWLPPDQVPRSSCTWCERHDLQMRQRGKDQKDMEQEVWLRKMLGSLPECWQRLRQTEWPFFLFKFQLLHPAELPASTIKCIVVGLAKSVFTIMALPRQQLWMGQGIGGHSAADVDMCTTLAGNMRVVTPVTRYSETLVPKSSNWVLPIRHIGI